MSTAVWRLHVTCVDLDEPVCRLASCRGPLPPRRRAFCSDRHARAFERDHVWFRARVAARRRAGYACERCGFKPSEIRRDPVARRAYPRHMLRLEVNHIRPLEGDYRGVTCANHGANLEVLCHACHVAWTAEQRTRARPRPASPAERSRTPRAGRPGPGSAAPRSPRGSR